MKISDQIDSMYVRASFVQMDVSVLRSRDDLRETVTEIENIMDEVKELADRASEIAKEAGL